MEIISRDEARAAKNLYYDIGAPCARGHASVRYVSTGSCKACQAQDAKARSEFRKASPECRIVDARQRKAQYEANADERRRRSREWSVLHPKTEEQRVADNIRRKNHYRENIEHAKEAGRLWRIKNRDKKLRDDAQWQRDNPERVKERNKRWQEKNKDAVRSFTRNYRAKKKAAVGFHTGEDIKDLFRDQSGICACGCGVSLAAGYDVDHITPVSRGGENWPSNLQLLTPSCNKSKNDKTMAEWMLTRRLVASPLIA
jgi:5-methylcytosine-specific restriction endonuclease McrA